MERSKRIIYRWFELILLSIISVIICCLFRSQIINIIIGLNKSIADWGYWVQVVIALFFTTSLWFIVGKLGGACFSGFFTKKTICNPPVWIFGVVSFIFYFLLTLNKFDVGEYHRNYVMTIAMSIAIGTFAIGGVIASMLSFICEKTEGNRLTKAEADLDNNAQDFDEVVKDPKMLIEWIHKEEPIEEPSQDYFDMDVFAQRIEYILRRTPLKTIGLVGRYGCGKSSILKMVEYYVENPQKLKDDNRAPGSKDFYPSKDVIICWVSGWGFREGTAAQHVLQAATNQLGKHTDCLSITTLPARYSRAIGDSGNVLARIIGNMLCGWQSPIDILKKLDILLDRIEKRMVIFLEDIDRNKRADVFFNEISALLDGLKELKNVTFVLAIGEEHKGQEVIIKTSEHIETIPNLPYKNVVDMCKTFREYCLGMLDSDVREKFYGDKEDRIGLDRSDIVQSIAQFEEYLKKPIDYIVEMLNNPRVAKIALRRTWQIWQNLCGEIDFDDVLVANVIRAGANEAFIFINENITMLRSLSNMSRSSEAKERRDKNRARLQEEFARAAERMKCDSETANKLINCLFPGWDDSIGTRGIMLSERLKNSQNIHNSEPTDYWGRLCREKIQSDEIRDQEVINSLTSWKEGKEEKIFRGLKPLDAILENKDFFNKAIQFGMLLDGNKVRCLAEKQFELTLKKYGNKANPENCPGFDELRQLELASPMECHGERIKNQICDAIKTSMRFAIDIYRRYWDQIPFLNMSRLTPIQLIDSVVAEAKKTYENNPEALIGALDSKDMWSIRNFAHTFIFKRDGKAEHQKKQWAWLRNVILTAGERNPQIIVPQLAPLVVQSDQKPTGNGWKCNCVFLNKQAENLFTEKMPELMRLLNKPIKVSDFDDLGQTTINCARGAAKEWLSEHEEDSLGNVPRLEDSSEN